MAESAKEWGPGPTVMWRMMRTDGQTAHAVIDPSSSGAAVIWFVNDRPMGIRDFEDWSGALRWSDQLQTQNWATGWRLVPD
ncbi:MAG: hypothetical protein AB7R67_21420 [Vicinamibacterales bacterium]